MKLILILAMASALSLASAEIGSDLLSTLKIVNKLCYFPGDHSDPISKEFFDCYDQVPEHKAKFSDCQIEAFGNILDTNDHVDVACKRPWLMGGYVSCLKKAFAGAEEEMDAAVLTVNKCQGAIFGLY